MPRDRRGLPCVYPNPPTTLPNPTLPYPTLLLGCTRAFLLLRSSTHLGLDTPSPASRKSERLPSAESLHIDPAFRQAQKQELHLRLGMASDKRGKSQRSDPAPAHSSFNLLFFSLSNVPRVLVKCCVATGFFSAEMRQQMTISMELK